jgi:hypothetical protein
MNIQDRLSGDEEAAQIFDTFTADNGTTIQGRLSDTGHVWAGANHNGLEVATIQSNALTGPNTTWYSKIVSAVDEVSSAGVTLSVLDKGSGDAGHAQTFVFLVGPNLDDLTTLEGRAFLHLVFWPNVTATNTERMTIDASVNGVGGLFSVYQDQRAGSAMATERTFEFYFYDSSVIIRFPGGLVRATDARFAQCAGRYIWIEGYNPVADARYYVSVKDFWCNKRFSVSGSTLTRDGKNYAITDVYP